VKVNIVPYTCTSDKKGATSNSRKFAHGLWEAGSYNSPHSGFVAGGGAGATRPPL